MKKIILKYDNFFLPKIATIKKPAFIFFYKMKALFCKIKKFITKCNLFFLNERHTLFSYSAFNLLKKNQKRILFPGEIINILDPKIFQKENYFIVKNTNKIYFPEIYLSIIKNAKIIGNSSLVWTENYALIFDNIDIKKNIMSEELHSRIKIINNEVIKRKKKNNYNIEKAALFLDACSSNYAHWLTEILPRVFVFINNREYKDYPLLVDKNISSSMIESLNLLCEENRKVYFVDKNIGIKIKKLVVISEVGIVPFQTKSKFNNNNTDSVKFSKKVILDMRSHLCNKVQNFNPYKYVFIKRISSNKKILNEDLIERYLMSIGFVSLDFANLNFSDQINIFKNAKCIIASSGAALANLVFATQKTKIIILIGASKLVSYFYWINMASAVNIKINFVLGEIPSSDKNSLHPNFFVPLKLLKTALYGSK